MSSFVGPEPAADGRAADGEGSPLSAEGRLLVPALLSPGEVEWGEERGCVAACAGDGVLCRLEEWECDCECGCGGREMAEGCADGGRGCAVGGWWEEGCGGRVNAGGSGSWQGQRWRRFGGMIGCDTHGGTRGDRRTTSARREDAGPGRAGGAQERTGWAIVGPAMSKTGLRTQGGSCSVCSRASLTGGTQLSPPGLLARSSACACASGRDRRRVRGGVRGGGVGVGRAGSVRGRGDGGSGAGWVGEETVAEIRTKSGERECPDME